MFVSQLYTFVSLHLCVVAVHLSPVLCFQDLALLPAFAEGTANNEEYIFCINEHSSAVVLSIPKVVVQIRFISNAHLVLFTDELL